MHTNDKTRFLVATPGARANAGLDSSTTEVEERVGRIARL